MSSWSGKVCEKTPGEGKGLEGPCLPQAGGMRGGVCETDRTRSSVRDSPDPLSVQRLQILYQEGEKWRQNPQSFFIDSFGIWRETGTRPGEVRAGEFIKIGPLMTCSDEIISSCSLVAEL